jgi:endonuclease/exonuclease/phosphatase family metal-dependent hydrolase
MGPERTSPASVLFGTYNLLNLFEDDSAAGREHYRLVVETIRALGADVLAVQEIRAPDAESARARLGQLADDVGLSCRVPDPLDSAGSADDSAGSAGGGAGSGGRVALAMGPHGFHVGLMWRDGIEAVPGSLRSYGRGDFWHSLACVTLDTGGRRVRHAAHHATPFGRRLRADQNERLVAALTGAPWLPTLVGADWNTECADRIRDDASGDWVLYEPRDPYAGVDWFRAMLYQCDWDYDGGGRRRHWADRRPGDVLWSGGLHDAAAVLRAPWQPTVGHHPADSYGAHGIWRRIDGIRVTEPVVGALRAHHVQDTELARRASDHLPVLVEYVPSAIAGREPSAS